ncbi:MAG: glycosyltransferase [Bacteroidaceae bacterium]|nr:glycosyltransferase [Bacteroidaceae bacterium]
MKQFPSFTIVTVTFNAGATIGRTLNSVSSQTYEAIEHLIIDGCSSDDTMREIHLYVERNTDTNHPHTIRLIREPDKGLYDAMNKALLQAKGNYVVFLNAGDKFHDNDTLAKVSAAIRKYSSARQPAIAYGETDLVDGDGQFIRHRRLSVPDRLTSRSFLLGMLVCHQSFYVRSDIAHNFLYDLRYRYSADYDWCIRVIRHAEKRGLPMANVGTVLTDYLSEGMTTRHQRASLIERLRIMGRHFGWIAALAAHVWILLRAIFVR